MKNLEIYSMLINLVDWIILEKKKMQKKTNITLGNYRHKKLKIILVPNII